MNILTKIKIDFKTFSETKFGGFIGFIGLLVLARLAKLETDDAYRYLELVGASPFIISIACFLLQLLHDMDGSDGS